MATLLHLALTLFFFRIADFGHGGWSAGFAICLFFSFPVLILVRMMLFIFLRGPKYLKESFVYFCVLAIAIPLLSVYEDVVGEGEPPKFDGAGQLISTLFHWIAMRHFEYLGFGIFYAAILAGLIGLLDTVSRRALNWGVQA